MDSARQTEHWGGAMIQPHKPSAVARVTRVARRVAIALVILCVIGLTALVPLAEISMGLAKPVTFSKVYAASDFDLNATPLTLTTSDQLSLSAYEVAVENPKAVVIFISGIQNPSVTAFFGHARMMRDDDYASVLFEMRAHSPSEGDRICYGLREVRDTQAAVDYIRGQVKYQGVPIVVYGLSMGAGVAINSIGSIPEVDALISISAFASWEDVLADNLELMGAPHWFATVTKPFSKLYLTLRFGPSSFVMSPKTQIRNLGDRPALLLHSEGDTQVPFVNLERILRDAPPGVETWTKPGDFHAFLPDNQFLTPYENQEYQDRIIGFLDEKVASRAER